MGLKLTAMQMIKRLFQSSSAFRPAALWGLAGIFCAGWSGPGLAADLIIEQTAALNDAVAEANGTSGPPTASAISPTAPTVAAVVAAAAVAVTTLLF